MASDADIGYQISAQIQTVTEVVPYPVLAIRLTPNIDVLNVTRAALSAIGVQAIKPRLGSLGESNRDVP